MYLQWLTIFSSEMTEALGVLYFNFSKASITISCNIFIDKLMRNGFQKWTVRWILSWQKYWAKSIMISGTKSSWRLVTTGILQVSILGSDSVG